MNKILLSVTLIALTALSCSKKEDDTPPIPDTTLYEGTWRGTYSGGVNGTWIFNITGTGETTGTYIGGINGGGRSAGTVTESGIVEQSFTNGGTGTGRVDTFGYYSGTWMNNDPNNPLSDTSSGRKD